MPKRTDISSIIVIGAGTLLLASCGPQVPDIAHQGEEAPLNKEQFEYIKEQCGLDDATLGRDSWDRPQIKLSRLRDDNEMPQMIVCVKKTGELLNAEFTIGLPDGQMGVSNF